MATKKSTAGAKSARKQSAEARATEVARAMAKADELVEQAISTLRGRPKTPEEKAAEERVESLLAFHYSPIPSKQRDRATRYLFDAGKALRTMQLASREDMDNDQRYAFEALVDHLAQRSLELLSAAGAALNDDDLLEPWCEESELQDERCRYERRRDGKPETDEEQAKSAEAAQ